MAGDIMHWGFSQAFMINISVQFEQSFSGLLEGGRVIIYGTSKWYSSTWERLMISLRTVLLLCVF